VLLAASSMAPVVDEAAMADARYPRSGQEGK
jgi:hypothetical protein